MTKATTDCMNYQLLKTILACWYVLNGLQTFAVPQKASDIEYSDITVDETGMVYVTTKKSSGTYGIQQFDGTTWKNITPLHHGSIYKIIGEKALENQVQHFKDYMPCLKYTKGSIDKRLKNRQLICHK